MTRSPVSVAAVVCGSGLQLCIGDDRVHDVNGLHEFVTILFAKHNLAYSLYVFLFVFSILT